MSKPVIEKQHVAAKIEEAAKKYMQIMENTENEIAKIKQQLIDIGVQGSTIVKMKPIWHHDVYYLLKQEIENPGDKISKKAG